MHTRRAGLLPALLVAVLAAACGRAGPRPIRLGAESCDYCRMTIGDARFGAELVTRTGKVRRFDSIECLAGYSLRTHGREEARSLWVSDFRRPGTFLPADSARFVKGGEHSPMGLGIAAFAGDADAQAMRRRSGGEVLRWPQVLERVAREGDHPRAGLPPHAD